MQNDGTTTPRKRMTNKKATVSRRIKLSRTSDECGQKHSNWVKTLLFNVDKNKKGGRFDFSIETSTLSLCWYTTYTASDEHNLVYKMLEILTVIILCTERTHRKEWLLVNTYLQSSFGESLPHHTMHTQLANSNYSLGKQPKYSKPHSDSRMFFRNIRGLKTRPSSSGSMSLFRLHISPGYADSIL